MKTLEQIDRELDLANESYEAKWHEKTEQTWEEFQKYTEAEVKQINELSRQKRLIMPYEMKEIPEYGDVMSLEDFIACCKDGSFIDYDGSGHYAKDNMMSNITIIPSDVTHNMVRKDFDTVVWFNR